MIVADSNPVAAVHALPAERAPVTLEEAAALARRIRVEAKLPRVALVGTVLGLVCGVAAIWPFLDSDGYMANALVSSDSLGPLSFLPGWLLAGLLPLLAFYAGRLHFERGRSSTGQIETSLRKIRLIILASMFACAAAFVFVLMQERQHQRGEFDRTSWLTVLYVACFSACGVIIGDVRRGLGDFDTEYQRRRRRLVRGFMVELRPTVAIAAAQDDIPMASIARPAITPPPLPALAVLPKVEVGEDEHFKDLRLLMTVAIATAIFVHGVRLGETLAFSRIFSSLGSITPTTVNPFTTTAMPFARVAGMLLLPCGILWVIWGIISLTYGPTFRRTIGALTIVTLALALLYALPAWVDGQNLDYTWSRPRSELGGRLARAPEIVHCVFLGMLLTRPGVKRLFSRSSEMVDDPDRA